MKNINKYLLIFLLFSSINVLIAKDIKIPQIIQSAIIKQYNGQNIVFLSIIKIQNSKFIVIIKTEYGKDKIIINKKGKIYSISDYLEELNIGEGC